MVVLDPREAEPMLDVLRWSFPLAPAVTLATGLVMAPWKYLPKGTRPRLARVLDVGVALPLGGLLLAAWLRERLDKPSHLARVSCQRKPIDRVDSHGEADGAADPREPRGPDSLRSDRS